MKYCEDFIVLENTSLNPYYYLLRLKTKKDLPEIEPGQFVNLLVKDVSDRILRRPISIYDVDKQNNTLCLVIQKIGKATEKLSTCKLNTTLSVMYPLGNGFPTSFKKPLLVGGGVGVAPLYYLSKCFNDKDVRPTVLIGAKSKRQLFSIKEFDAISNVHISTEDGSFGEKGFLTQNTILNNNDFDAILTCGPTIMMKAVSDIAKKKNLPCYVSLENRMACGIGACLCCVVDSKEGNVCTCTEGPVFLSNDLKQW
jgi:dihydroorotate dehydrogenase electron transfer subunit